MQWVILFLFCVILLVIAIVRRGAFLDTLVWKDGEKTLFEEDAKFESFIRGTSRNKSVFPNTHVVVTNQRIILAQKILFGKRYQIAMALAYGGEGDLLSGADLMGGGIRKLNGEGFMTFNTTLENVHVKEEGGKSFVEVMIPIVDSGPFLAAPKFIIYTTRPQEYAKVFQS